MWCTPIRLFGEVGHHGDHQALAHHLEQDDEDCEHCQGGRAARQGDLNCPGSWVCHVLGCDGGLVNGIMLMVGKQLASGSQESCKKLGFTSEMCKREGNTGSSIITGVKIMAYCSKIKSPGDFLRLLGACQMWSIW